MHSNRLGVLIILFRNGDTLFAFENARMSLHNSYWLDLSSSSTKIWAAFSVIFLVLVGYHTWLWICLPTLIFFYIFLFSSELRKLLIQCGRQCVYRLPSSDSQSSVAWLRLAVTRSASRASISGVWTINSAVEFGRLGPGPWCSVYFTNFSWYSFYWISSAEPDAFVKVKCKTRSGWVPTYDGNLSSESEPLNFDFGSRKACILLHIVALRDYMVETVEISAISGAIYECGVRFNIFIKYAEGTRFNTYTADPVTERTCLLNEDRVLLS